MGPQDLVNLLKREVVPAIGCTEPVAIALTSAYAFNLIKGDIKNIKMKISSNVYKNAKAVGIPGTDHTGIEMALALGTTMKEPVYDLTILAHLTEEDTKKALEIRDSIPIDIEVLYNSPKVHIDVEVDTNNGMARAIISHKHTNLVYLQSNDKVILDKRSSEKDDDTKQDITAYPLEELILQVLNIPFESLEFLLKGIDINMAMAKAGMEMKVGMNIGSSWKRLSQRGLLGDDLNNDITLHTAAACDARMAGVSLPVMSSSGSGNNGLIAIIPIARVAKRLNYPKEKVAQALAISHLVNTYIKGYIGRLSPICGCGVSAGAGAAAGITYLMEGDMGDINRAIINVLSSLAGMICDGGKVGCSLKLSASAGMAWQAAILASEGVKVPVGNGIVGSNIQETLENLRILSDKGMAEVDRSVISVMCN
mgnify:FL=1